jgi:hypothetical protein
MPKKHFGLGHQVVHIPGHVVDFDMEHEDVRYGFISSETFEKGMYSVRYWRTKKSKIVYKKDEKIHSRFLYSCNTHTEEEINTAMIVAHIIDTVST